MYNFLKLFPKKIEHLQAQIKLLSFQQIVINHELRKNEEKVEQRAAGPTEVARSQNYCMHYLGKLNFEKGVPIFFAISCISSSEKNYYSLRSAVIVVYYVVKHSISHKFFKIFI